MKFSLFLFLMFAIGAFMLPSCTADELPEPMEMPCDGVMPVYEGEIRGIIEQTCAYSGCHLGGAPGVYIDYNGLLPDLESGRFRERVVQQRANPTVGMPPDYAPEGRPTELTERQLQLITCWLEAGFPRE